jgi:hypothetical protein
MGIDKKRIMWYNIITMKGANNPINRERKVHMYIRLKDNYYNLEHVASIKIDEEVITVLLKNRATSDFIYYKTPAEALAAFDKIWETVEQHNLSKTK